MYEDLGTLRQNARVTSEYRDDYQELVDEISELLSEKRASVEMSIRDFTSTTADRRRVVGSQA